MVKLQSYQFYTVEQLRNKCKSKNIKGYSYLNKTGLISALVKYVNDTQRPRKKRRLLSKKVRYLYEPDELSAI